MRPLVVELEVTLRPMNRIFFFVFVCYVNFLNLRVFIHGYALVLVFRMRLGRRLGHRPTIIIRFDWLYVPNYLSHWTLALTVVGNRPYWHFMHLILIKMNFNRVFWTNFNGVISIVIVGAIFKED